MASRFDSSSSGSSEDEEEAPQLDGMVSSEDEVFEDAFGDVYDDLDAGELELPEDTDDDDTTPEMLRNGVDAQGIDWARLQLSREDYRERRLKQLDNYLNLPAAVAAAAARIDREATRSLPPRPRSRSRRAREDEGRTPAAAATAALPFSPGSPPSAPLPLAFSRNSRAVRCSVAHFQLRNLLYTPSLHEAYVVHASRLVAWDSATRERTVVLDLSGSDGGGLGGDGGGEDDWRAMLAGAARRPPFANSRVPLPPLPAPPAWAGAFPMLSSAAATAAGEERGRFVSRRVQIATAAVGLGLAALGGFNGEVAVGPTGAGFFPSSSASASTSSRGASKSGPEGSVGMRVTTSDNGITNGLELSGGASRGSSTLPRVPDFGEGETFSPSSPSTTTLFSASNDGFVRAFDASTWQRTLLVDCGWAVNFATASPDGALLAAVGDDPEAVLLDPRCRGGGGGGGGAGRSNSAAPLTTPTTMGKSGVAALRGHLDFSFAAAWHPSGLLLATGNQDATARVWDLRNTKESLHVLKSELGAVRSLRFSPDGALLAAAEPADFVKVYDVRGEGGGLGSGGGGSVRLRPRSSSRRPSSSSLRLGEEELREAEEEGQEEEEEEEEEGLIAALPSGTAAPFATCGACSGGGCPRCVDLALRHRDRLQRLRRRRKLVLEQQTQQRQESRRRKRRIDDDEEEEEEEDEEGKGGRPLLGESTDDDDNDNGGRGAKNNTSADDDDPLSLLRRGPFETAQVIDFFGECAGISWSPCGSRLSVAVADATYSSLLQFDRV